MKNTFNPSVRRIAMSLALASTFAGIAHATDEPFNVTMNLQSPIAITETNALSFVDTNTGSGVVVVTAAADVLAATFTATGTPSTPATGSVVEASITMITGGGGATEQIVVDTFTTGGDMNAAGATTFDGTGNLADLRIGGSANVLATNVAGSYAGTATFRLIY